MRVALIHNLQTDDSEAQAEFDTVETIAALLTSLERLGHVVRAIDVSGSLAAALTELEQFGAQLVFNTAEGRGGPLREALFPALFEELGLAYTGSDPVACALTLDKHRTKATVAAVGVATPAAVLIEDLADLAELDLGSWPVPAIVKPNFEGSSKGVTDESIVRDARDFPAVVAELLGRYPVGVLVEAFISGRDVTVPWLERVGVLPAAEYEFGAPRADEIYDYGLKQHGETVRVRTPAQLEPAVARELAAMSERVVAALGVRDLARLDFRVTDEGEVWFLELNALPSLELGASLYESAALVGLREPEQVLGAVIDSAAARFGLGSQVAQTRARPSLTHPRVGLIYNLRRVDPRVGDDRDAEFDSRETIAAVRAAIERAGCEVIELEAKSDLPRALTEAKPDLVFNIAEGIRGRAREAQVPALLELLGIPHTGSDAVTMALTLDKTLAKSVVAAAGVSTPAWAVLRSGHEPLPEALRYPVFIKPIAEGSSKGIDGRAFVSSDAELRERAAYLIERYAQPALVEAYLPGREFTVGVLESFDGAVLPPMEIVHLDGDGDGDGDGTGDGTETGSGSGSVTGRRPAVYGFDTKLGADAAAHGVRYDAPAKLSPDLDRALRTTALAAFRALGCRDFARVDLRLDKHGEVHFIECNPLPGLTPGWSDLCMIGASVGLDYDQLIAAILAPALDRAGLTSTLRRSERSDDARQG